MHHVGFDAEVRSQVKFCRVGSTGKYSITAGRQLQPNRSCFISSTTQADTLPAFHSVPCGGLCINRRTLLGNFQARQMRCCGSRLEYITGWLWALEACWLRAVAAWVRRLPLRVSKSSVLTLCSQRTQVKRMPPCTRLVV